MGDLNTVLTNESASAPYSWYYEWDISTILRVYNQDYVCPEKPKKITKVDLEAHQ